MNHLSDEEFEALLRGELPAPEHLAACAACRERLAELQAVAARLRSAFESVPAGEALTDRIRSQVRAANSASPAGGTDPYAAAAWRSKMTSRVPRWAWAALGVAALLAVMAVPLSMILTNRPVAAAEAELVRIHNHNLSPGHEFYGESDPAALAEYFKKKLGFQPALPELGHGMKMRGCCIEHFRGAPVGSYVVDTPQGVISIIVVNDVPESFSKTTQISKGGQTLWTSNFGHCNMVSIRLNGYTYCAVGSQDVSHDVLADLLLRLLSPAK